MSLFLSPSPSPRDTAHVTKSATFSAVMTQYETVIHCPNYVKGHLTNFGFHDQKFNVKGQQQRFIFKALWDFPTSQFCKNYDDC